MYWKETEPATDSPEATGDVLDLAFRVRGRFLPVDHAYGLSSALCQALPWLEDEPRAGIHLIHVAQSGNGWQRPDGSRGELLNLSRRTRLTLRLPRERLEAAGALTGRTLDVAGHPLEVGEAAARALAPARALFARYVVVDGGDDDEEAFLAEVARLLRGAGVEPRKLLCGMRHAIATPAERLRPRSLLVADLRDAESLALQRDGIGHGRRVGCGLFVPHKDVAAVSRGRDA